MIAVGWGQPAKALSDVAVLASSVQTHIPPDAVLDHYVVALIDWNALVDLARSGELNPRPEKCNERSKVR